MEPFASWLQWTPQLLAGLLVSLEVTSLSLLFGVPLGLCLALLSSAQNRFVKSLTIVFVEVGRGAPVLVMLELFYFGLPQIGIRLDSIPAAVVALSITTGAYTSEIIRAGIRAVPVGELEAGSALGIRHADVMRFVVIPQGIRIALPTLMGFAILILQVSSLTFTLAVPELLSEAYSIGAATFRYLDVLTLAGLMYLLITVPAGWLVQRFETRLSRHLT